MKPPTVIHEVLDFNPSKRVLIKTFYGFHLIWTELIKRKHSNVILSFRNTFYSRSYCRKLKLFQWARIKKLIYIELTTFPYRTNWGENYITPIVTFLLLLVTSSVSTRFVSVSVHETQTQNSYFNFTITVTFKLFKKQEKSKLESQS